MLVTRNLNLGVRFVRGWGGEGGEIIDARDWNEAESAPSGVLVTRNLKAVLHSTHAEHMILLCFNTLHPLK